MKLRKHKHIKQEQQGWPNTHSGRTKKNDPYCYEPEFSPTARPFVSVKWTITVRPRQSWRK